MDQFFFFVSGIGGFFVILSFFVRIERRLTKLERDIFWIVRKLDNWQQNSDKDMR
jgi:hypothetical protein